VATGRHRNATACRYLLRRHHWLNRSASAIRDSLGPTISLSTTLKDGNNRLNARWSIHSIRLLGEMKLMLKIVAVSFSNVRGGAAIAARNFRLLIENRSYFEVDTISQDSANKFQFFKRLISYIISKLQFDGNPTKHSLNIFSFKPVLLSFKNSFDSIHHIHWINNDTISIFDFDIIPSGSIFTLHDEWLYCGAEHYYKVLDDSNDFIYGYSLFKKGIYGIHWNYFIWEFKKRKLQNRTDLIFTVPSFWMLQRASQSLILKGHDIRLLPNPIDTKKFRPSGRSAIDEFRKHYSFDETHFVFSFGAVGGKKNKLKGAHLLESALRSLSAILPTAEVEKIILIDFGGIVAKKCLYGFRNLSIGKIKDPAELALLYSSSDCVVAPSMVESFGQVAAEALSCSTPVISFDTSGLRDIVIHNKTGFLANAFDTNSLAEQLLKIIKLSKAERQLLGKHGREHVLSHFSYEVVSKAYFSILDDASRIKRRHAK
jgi:glycosyltransferase involved in cell wall biosynthesis